MAGLSGVPNGSESFQDCTCSRVPPEIQILMLQLLSVGDIQVPIVIEESSSLSVFSALSISLVHSTAFDTQNMEFTPSTQQFVLGRRRVWRTSVFSSGRRHQNRSRSNGEQGRRPKKPIEGRCPCLRCPLTTFPSSRTWSSSRPLVGGSSFHDIS